MEGLRFDGWVRMVAARINRRGLLGVVGSAVALRANTGADAKKKKKKKKKGSSSGCGVQYFDCNGECRLSGACCDDKPGYTCAERHPGEPGRWVCCSHAGFGCYDLDSDKFNCNECGHACTGSDVCCHGACQFGPCLP